MDLSDLMRRMSDDGGERDQPFPQVEAQMEELTAFLRQSSANEGREFKRGDFVRIIPRATSTKEGVKDRLPYMFWAALPEGVSADDAHLSAIVRDAQAGVVALPRIDCLLAYWHHLTGTVVFEPCWTGALEPWSAQ